MTIVVKPGKYLIEKSRRRIIGVIAHVGTGGSVPKPVQDALNEFASSIHGPHADTALRVQERVAIRTAMKSMSGRILVLTPHGGLRWAADHSGLMTSLKNSGWKPPADQLDLMASAPSVKVRQRKAPKPPPPRLLTP